MKLDVDFSSLELAAAKMQGLDNYLTILREKKYSFDKGLTLAKEYVKNNQGTISSGDEEGQVVLELLNERAVCFQLYPDIDRFYFET